MTMSQETMTDAERREFLSGLGLSPDAAVLAQVEPNDPAKPVKGKVAPKGVDPHTMPVTDIVFDAALLDDHPVLDGVGLKAASDYVFSLYRSPGRNKDRHSLLHRRISEFIGQVRLSRASGGHVKELVKATKEQRAIAALLASKGLTLDDLAQLLGEPAKE